jgi:hypothetical protein
MIKSSHEIQSTRRGEYRDSARGILSRIGMQDRARRDFLREITRKAQTYNGLSKKIARKRSNQPR